MGRCLRIGSRPDRVSPVHSPAHSDAEANGTRTMPAYGDAVETPVVTVAVETPGLRSTAAASTFDNQYAHNEFAQPSESAHLLSLALTWTSSSITCDWSTSKAGGLWSESSSI